MVRRVDTAVVVDQELVETLVMCDADCLVALVHSLIDSNSLVAGLDGWTRLVALVHGLVHLARLLDRVGMGWCSAHNGHDDHDDE